MPHILPTPDTEDENRVIVISDVAYRATKTSALMTDRIPNLHLCAAIDGHQCFPFYVYDEDGGNRRENITDWALGEFRGHYGTREITKWDIFHYVYGLLHHPGYRERYAENLKKELPRVPFAPEFSAFRDAGRELSALHLGYEEAEPWPLEYVWDAKKTPSWRVEKMKLSKDKTAVVVNDTLTLRGIPERAHEYRLGNRSAVEWVIDQYRVKEDTRSGIVSDPNRSDDEQYIVDLIRRVVRVSVETTRIVDALAGKGFRP